MEAKQKIETETVKNEGSKSKKDIFNLCEPSKEQKVENKPKNRKRTGSMDRIDQGLTIRLLGNRSVHQVSVEDFGKVSQLIKQQQNAGNLMSSVDLNKFSDQSILAFVNYIQTKEIKSSLTYYAITELLTLAKTFQMKDLKAGLEDSIVDASANSEADLLQALIICDVTHISPETERTLQTSAIDNIQKIVNLPDFHKMPFQQFFQIMSSCELIVSHEMFVADVILLWLSSQNNVNAYAPALFSCIRTRYLSPVDKTLIIERISTWNIHEKVVRLARNTFESSNSQRICLDVNHLKKNYSRCAPPGIVSISGTHSNLPLSRPNFSIKMKKTKEGKIVERFDSAVEPKVTDLIKVAPSEKAKVKEIAVKKNVSKTTVKPKANTKPPKKAKTSKPKCVCVDFVKKKLAARKSKKSSKKSKAKENQSSKKTNSQKLSASEKSKSNSKSQKSDKSAKSAKSAISAKSANSSKSAKVPSKRSSMSKLGGNATKSDKKSNDRRNQKKSAIDSAMKKVKSDPKLNDSASKSMKSS